MVFVSAAVNLLLPLTRTRWVHFNKLRPHIFPQPRWRGEAVAGKTIFHAEQSFGDAIQDDVGANPRGNALASMSHSGYTIAGLAIAARKWSVSIDFSGKFVLNPAVSVRLKTVSGCPKNGGWPVASALKCRFLIIQQ
jgi:hypothetical protein